MNDIKTVISELTDMGLIKDGKPVSKNKLKDILDIVKYGRGKTAFNIGYAVKGHAKELMYQFNTRYIETKPRLIETIRYNLERLCDGDGRVLKEDIVRGNSGYPISHHKIYWK